MTLKHAYALVAFALCCANPAWAQDTARSALIQHFANEGARIRDAANGTVITPASSLSHPEDVGLRAHTHTKIFVPAALPSGRVGPNNSPPYSGYFFETPASLACVYNLVTPTNGCNPNTVITNATGGSRAVAIVDAYNNPTVRTDLAAYSAQFGLPAITTSNFIVWYCSARSGCQQTVPPSNNSGWALEISLDVEMVHALAPSATIYLVEAASNSNADLLAAVSKASALVGGGGEVSMSWGESEFSTESSYDTAFATNNVVYFASSGDSPGTIWPAVSSKVVCVGGTSVSRNSTGAFIGHSTWDEAGGGPSTYISLPPYQPSGIGSQRGCPDLSADANPATGVWVYCSASSCGGSGSWWIVGGTSVASPTWAAIVNNAGSFRANTAAELTMIYDGLAEPSAYAARWYDVTQGYCGPGVGNSGASTYVSIWAAPGYDFCTGVGAPNTTKGK